jgi:acyl-CoA thioester hydrolase
VTVGFSIPFRVYYEDTDAGGVVYYANYLHFMERARTEWLRSLGFEIDKLVEVDGVVFAVRSITVDYHKPARLNDLVTVGVVPLAVGRASIEVDQEIRREGTLLCRGRVKLACLDARTFAPRPLPKPITAELQAWTTS